MDKKIHNEDVIGNLEGGISEKENYIRDRVIFNKKDVEEYKEKIGLRAVSLANNHVFDTDKTTKGTKRVLGRNKVSSFGAGESIHEAQEASSLEIDGKHVVLLGFGWEVIGCPSAAVGKPGVNPLRAPHVLRSVRQTREKFPDALLVLFMHWNYEFELYPQPMHRELAFRTIDEGANAIVGTHSHRVQGIEVYRGAPVVHGLGNWMFAQGEYFGGTLTYPECASTELAFEWDPETGEMTCHWYEYDPETHRLTYTDCELVEDSKRVRKLTPYRGMTHREYVEFFRANRIKRRLLPVYSSCDDVLSNRAKDWWVYLRHKLIQSSIKMGLKGGSRSS